MGKLSSLFNISMTKLGKGFAFQIKYDIFYTLERENRDQNQNVTPDFLQTVPAASAAFRRRKSGKAQIKTRV
ncbi:hypothetical protein C3V36_09085 [Lachnospiraceae bacterium oral taxon 500]|nr:hypothetical protein C3V36_09085 [Lachnospiraceae bacterium oral taxon 500]